MLMTEYETTMVVINAPTSELASEATSLLIDKLKASPDLFREVKELGMIG